MSGEIFTTTTLEPIVSALQGAITVGDIVNLFTSGVTIALPLILVWFGARWVENAVCSFKSLLTYSKGVTFNVANGESIATPC